MRYFESERHRHIIVTELEDMTKFFDVKRNSRTKLLEIGGEIKNIFHVSFHELMTHAKPELKDWLTTNASSFGGWPCYTGSVTVDYVSKWQDDIKIHFSFENKATAMLFKLAWS